MALRTWLGMWMAGVCFGGILSRSGAADYDYIQRMFLLEDFQLYGIIGGAVAFAAPLLFLMRRRGRIARGEALDVTRKPLHKGVIPGAILFGIGWSITGMCPGPIFVNIGEGKWPAIAALLGALTGAYVQGRFRSTLQRVFSIEPE